MTIQPVHDVSVWFQDVRGKALVVTSPTGAQHPEERGGLALVLDEPQLHYTGGDLAALQARRTQFRARWSVWHPVTGEELTAFRSKLYLVSDPAVPALTTFATVPVD